jgi:glucose-1-phosphate thymidylyltransferase
MRDRPKGLLVVEDGAPDARARPHALGEVSNAAIALHALRALEAAGAEDIIVASSAGAADEVRSALACHSGEGTTRLNHLVSSDPLDLAGALDLAAPIVGDAGCIVHLADGLLGEPIAALMSGLRPGRPDALVLVHQAHAPRGRLGDETLGMLHLAELDPDRLALGMAGVWLFGPGALQRAVGAGWASAREVDLRPLAGGLENAGGRLNVLRAEAWRRFSGDPVELLELNRMALDDLEPETRRMNGNDIEGRVRIDEHASVRASVIVGPAVIGPGALVSDAYIGPYTSIGAGARIEGAEIERSIVGRNASITHVGGRIVASVVGSNARVFRDFSLPRALRLRVGDGTEVALC